MYNILYEWSRFARPQCSVVGSAPFAIFARIDARIGRLRLGNFGDVKSVGDGVSELRIDFGPGHRVYFMRHGDKVVVLLCAGDKGSQVRDIKLAKAMAAELKG